jgi:hypothetical protein
MYYSIAPIEITTQMRRQFTDTIERHVPRSHPVRRRMSLALHALANRLAPAPIAG